MSLQAVIFDLFFTLVDPLGRSQEEMTEYKVLGMDKEEFEALNAVDYEVRGCGRIRDPYLMMAHILRNKNVSADLVRRATDVRLERIKRAIWRIESKNMALLRRLRQAGYKIGLISNADAADIHHWSASPLSNCFDETIFSYDAGILKPDPRIYRLAAERLQVRPKDCLFVGDGGHQELQGAREAGMITVLTTEYISRSDSTAGADYVVTSLEAITELEVLIHTLKSDQHNKEHITVQKETDIILEYTPFDQRISKSSERTHRPWYIEPAAPIEVLNLSVRSFNALNRVGITTIGMMLDTDEQQLQRIKQLGVKSINEILSWQEKIREAIINHEDNFEGASVRQKRIQKLAEAFERIPAFRLDKSIQAYLDSYCGLDRESMLSNMEQFLKPLKTVAEIPSVFDKVCVTHKSTTDLLTALKVLSSDLKAILQSLLAIIYSNPKHHRLIHVLQYRHNGLTLQEIADKSGLTRERIRQIKTKGFDMVLRHMNTVNIDIFMFISAEYQGELLLTTKEVRGYFDDMEHIDILLYTAKIQGLSNTFQYHKHFDIFFHTGMIRNLDRIVGAVKNIPYIIEAGRREEVLSDLCREESLPLKATAVEFDRVYKLSCKVYHKKNLLSTQMYEYVLDKYYPNGIRLYNDETIYAFRQKIIEVFGSIELPRNNRAIDARLADIAILCNRGSYIHPNHIAIDAALVEDIRTYIMESSRKVFSFNELFETFKQKLSLHSNITNRYFLQGMLKYYLGDKFFITRYSISKQADTNLIEDIEEFIRMKGEVHKSEIFTEYAGITEIMLSIKVNSNKNLINIGKGWYIHVDRLRIEKRDYRLSRILEEHTKTIPISTRKLLELLWLSNSEFLTRNSITDHEKLFGVLRYMFEDKFMFSRPYIARLGTEHISSIHVIKQHLESYTAITISDLVDLCHTYQLYFFSIRILVKDLSQEFLRIDAKTLTRIKTEFDEEILAEIAKPIIEKIDEQGYLAAAKIEDYQDYPDIGFPWNAFLLRSIVERSLNDTIGVIDIYTTDTYTMNSIFVDPFLEIENYEALIRRSLKEKHSRTPFTAVEAAVEWLHKQGLLLSNPSKFLLDGSIIRVDDHGKVIVSE